MMSWRLLVGTGGDHRLGKLLEAIDALTSASQLPALLDDLLISYNLKTAAYIGSGVTGRPEQSPYLAVTYSAEWVEHYKRQRFLDVDPAVQVGLRRMLPIDWREFDRAGRTVHRLFGEASEFGLGRQGMSVPVRGRFGDRSLFSITCDTDDKSWRLLRSRLTRDLQILAVHLHQAIVRLEGGARTELPALSPRERECLLWTAEGKTSWETSVILGISERTVRFYLENARHKLGAANTTHAVIKAGQGNLLSVLP